MNINAKPGTPQLNSSLNFNTSVTAKTSANAGGVKISPNPITGREAAIAQLKILGYQPGDEFWVKLGNNIPLKCTVTNDGSFTVRECDKRLDEENNVIADPKGGSIWDVRNSIWNNGHNFILQQAKKGKDVFIIPNHCKGGIGKGHATKFQLVFFEVDDRPIPEQWQLINELAQKYGIVPAIVVYSGGKSLHIYYKLSQEVTAEVWQRLQRKCIILFKSDKAIQNLNREMRFAGFPRVNKGTEQTLEFTSDYEYTAEAFETALDASGRFPYELTNERWSSWRSRSGLGESALTLTDDEFYNHKKTNSLNEREVNLEDYDGSVKPLTAYLSRGSRFSLNNGGGEGERNEVGFSVACALVGAAAALNRLGINFSGDPYNLINDYGNNCTPPLSSNEVDAIWASANTRERASAISDNILIAIATGYRQKQEVKNLYPTEVKTEEGWLKFELETEQMPWGKKIKPENAEKMPKKGTFAVKAPTGAGKSELLIRFKELYPKSNYIALYTTIGLMRSACISTQEKKALDIPVRDDIDNGNDNIANTPDVALCYPSLHKLAGRIYDGTHTVLIIDEVRAGLEFLIQSSECNKENRRSKNLKAFIELVQNADLVLAFDAYLTADEINFINSYRPADSPVYFAEVTPSPSDRVVWQIDKQSTFLGLINQTVANGERIAIASDGQENAEALDINLSKILVKKNGETRPANVFRYDSATSVLEPQKEFLKDVNAYLRNHPEIDVLIWSPSLAQGVSITVTEHFSKQFSWNTHLLPTGFQQITRRLRDQVELFYYVDKKRKPVKGCDSWYVNDQLRYLQSNSESILDLLLIAQVNADADTCEAITAKLYEITRAGAEGLDPIQTMLAVQRARSAYFGYDRRERIKELLIHDGYTVLNYEEVEEKAILPREGADHDHKEAKNEIKLFKATTIATNEPLTEDEAEKLKNARVKSQIDALRLDRYFFDKKFPGFCEQLTKEYGLSGDKGLISFFYHLQKNKHWLATVVSRWSWQNEVAVANKDFYRLQDLLRGFNEGVTSAGDLLQIEAGYRKFARETKFWEIFGLGEIVNLSKCIKWVFKLENDEQLNQVLEFVQKDKPTAKEIKEFKEVFIKPLGRAYISGMANYFKIKIKADGEYISKWLVRRVHDATTKFGYTLPKVKKFGQAGLYRVSDDENDEQKIWRKLLEDALNVSTQKSQFSELEPLPEAASSHDIISNDIYRYSENDVMPSNSYTVSVPESKNAKNASAPNFVNSPTYAAKISALLNPPCPMTNQPILDDTKRGRTALNLDTVAPLTDTNKPKIEFNQKLYDSFTPEKRERYLVFIQRVKENNGVIPW